jgi:anti-anti-sigma regulatory factor
MAPISISTARGVSTITVDGDFTFEVNRKFRDIYQALPHDRPVIIDPLRASYIDSAGLGMLIRPREHAGKVPKSIRLLGANDTMRTIPEVANFTIA